MFTQIIFWLVAYLFLALITHFILLTAGPLLNANINLKANVTIALFFGFCNGFTSGFTDQIFERRFFYKRALGIVIILKAIISFVIFVILISIVRYAVYPYVQARYFNKVVTDPEKSWEHFFQLLLIYNIVAGLLINFVNQINNKYGPGVLVPILFGKYKNPKEEDRIFLFMDLKSSTLIAETLGHLKYSAFIRDSMLDINEVVPRFNAQIYQYVGDEVVVTWTVEKGKLPLYCIQFFFACEAKFASRAEYYLKEYGRSPQFKAGLHMGKVTAVEVGEIKRDIAYHGDTLNTTARIQSICNENNKYFLTSRYVLEHSAVERYYDTRSLGMMVLKGKKQAIEVICIEGEKSG
ncbi:MULTISPECIES: adenylate/guanylate cyclase domain-containing protein [Niastella]|uniref:Adenylate/guanylate cyclase domain-containing protein n=1 Tax=Niastella soli TaxID=2821487 RepID=A0ABS3YW65_9BACT|nr:adenylate/guanylate cyclase domain-containing protein [Niastella soli]MBO9202169.1 adenylate/guanylate cyclase domain-containing protein [Niastella soli]